MGEKAKTGLSRRDFVRAATVGATAIAGASVLTPSNAQAQESSPTSIPETWDYEADVVVMVPGP